MPEVRYPSADFPSPVAVALTLPDGWEPMPLAEALVAAGCTRYGSEFRPNVTVTSRRTGGATLGQVAQAVASELESAPEWEETGREFRTNWGGHETFRIEGAFAHPQLGTLYQAAEIAVVQRGPYADVLQFAGTCAGSQALEVLPEIRDIITGAGVYEI